MSELLYFKFRPNGGSSGGKVYTYKAGTYIPKSTYPSKDDAAALTNANANPTILDARGEADIFINGPTKVVLKDSDDNLIWTADNFDSVNDDIVDANGNKLITFNSALNAVNNINLSNAATSNSPILSGEGTDVNVGVGVRAKGTGKVIFPIGNVNISLGDTTLSSGDFNLTVGGITVTLGDLNMSSGSVILSDTTSTFQALPVGLVTWNGGSAVPSGWLECNGAAVSRSTYASLFTAIGTTYGAGDGSTTFNLPNQARRVLVGKGGSGTATLGNTIGSTGGTETHTLTSADTPAHTHGYSKQDDRDQPWLDTTPKVDLSWDATITTTASAGSGTAHNILQPSLVAMMIIRAY